MERKKDMEEYLKDYRINRFEDKRARLNQYESKLSLTFQNKLKTLIIEQENRQKENSEDKIKCFYFCRLMSSVYTESYESILGMSSSTLYLDEKRSQIYWFPECIYETIDKDMVEAEKILRRKFICIQEFELFYIKRKLLDDDWKLLKKVFVTLSKQSMNLIMNSSLKLDDEFLFLCGNYMENLKIMLQARVKN